MACYCSNRGVAYMTERAKMQRVAAVSRAFTPGTPVGRLDMLAGRTNQLTDIVSAVSMTGQHVGLYGERGVGKTSLANVLSEVFDSVLVRDKFQSARINCTTDDTFTTIWENVFAELGAEGDWMEAETLTPEIVRRALQDLDTEPLIVLDELDRLTDDDALTGLADTIKTLSDHATEATIVLVGVASSIGDLIGEHASISRALVQIEMPRMSRGELADIITKGCEEAEIAALQPAVDEIVALSEGLPHYTHLLALHAGLRAVNDDRAVITLEDVRRSIAGAAERHTILDAYQKAIRSARKDALFAQVLLACALAPKNPLGFFTSGSIREPLEVVADRRLDIPAFSNHLSQFLEPERACVLRREGTSRRYFYRFSDPILQPYVILKGLADGLITDEQLEQLREVEIDPELTPGDFETIETQRLF